MSLDKELVERKKFSRWLSTARPQLFIQICTAMPESRTNVFAIRLYAYVKKHHPEVLVHWRLVR